MISALDDLLMAATRVYNKYGSDKDWSEWRDLRAALVACGASPLPKQSDDEPLDK